MTVSKRGMGIMMRRAFVLLIALGLALLGGCADGDAGAAERNKATVLRFMSAFTVPSEEEAMAIVEDIVTDDFYFDDPPLPEQVRGVEGAKKWVRGERGLGPNPPNGQQREFIDLMLADARHVMVQKHLGGEGVSPSSDREVELMGLKGKPPGTMGSTTVLDVYYFTEGGKLSKLVERYDSLAVLTAFGFIPSMEEIEQLKAKAAQCRCAVEENGAGEMGK